MCNAVFGCLTLNVFMVTMNDLALCLTRVYERVCFINVVFGRFSTRKINKINVSLMITRYGAITKGQLQLKRHEKTNRGRDDLET